MAYQQKDNTALIATASEDIWSVRESFGRVMVEPSMNFDREAEFAIQILTKNTYTLSVAARNRQSLADAITNVAAIGLTLNPASKLAYLVPRNNAICLDVSYMGLLDLAVSCGSILRGEAVIVRQNDKFRRMGRDKEPLHEYDDFAKEEVRGPVVGVYCIVKLPNGDWMTETMTVDEVNDIRDRSEGYKAFKDPDKNAKSTPWETDYNEMAKKTVVKRASKYWPRTNNTARLDNAIQYLNTEGGEGFVDINQPPASKGDGMYDGPDVEKVLADGYKTTTDETALAYWNDHKAAFKKWPGVWTRFKDGMAAHRLKIRDGLIADPNTINTGITEVPEQQRQQASVIPPGMESLYADLDAAARGGMDDFSIAWGTVSKASRKKIEDSGAYAVLYALAEGKA